jgi:hypothetical protein
MIPQKRVRSGAADLGKKLGDEVYPLPLDLLESSCCTEIAVLIYGLQQLTGKILRGKELVLSISDSA